MSVDAEVEAVLQRLADDPCTVARWRPDERVLSITLLRGAVVVPISILVPEAGVPMFAYATDDGTSSEVAALCERISSAPTLPALISELLSVSSAKPQHDGFWTDGQEDHALQSKMFDRVLDVLVADPGRRAGYDCLLALLRAALQSSKRMDLCSRAVPCSNPSIRCPDEAAMSALLPLIDTMPKLASAAGMLTMEQAGS
jgi:hypothetical protein